MTKKLSRRDLLKGTALVAGTAVAGSVLSACTQVVKETVVVEKVVEKEVTKEIEKVVEKEVTKIVETAPTGPINSAGVVLPADALPLDKQRWTMGNAMTAAHGHTMKSNYNRLWSHAMYDEPLVGLDFNGDPYPAGCESYQISDDGLTWTFKLREDLTFTDGSPVTAEDWEWTMKRAMSSGYDYAWYFSDIKNAGAVSGGQLPADELGIEAIDDFTLTISSDMPTPYLPSVMCWFLVMSKKAYETHGEMYELDPKTFNGSGPWTLTKMDRATGCEWKVNENYKGVRTVYFETCYEGPLAGGLAAYMAGDVIFYDIGAGTPPGEQAFVNTNPVLRAESHPVAPFLTDYFGFNTIAGKFPPMDNPDVRLALCKAIDKETMVAEIGKGFALPAWGMLPKGFPGNNDDVLKTLEPNVFDIEAARQLLSKAGFPDGKGFPKLEFWCRDSVSAYAEGVQAAWKEHLGVEVNLKGSDYSGFTEQAFGQKAAPIYWVAYQLDYFDPATFLNIWRDGGRHPCEIPEWTAQYNAANAIMDPVARMEAIKEAEIALVNSTVFYGMDCPFSYKLFPCNLAGPGAQPNANGFSMGTGGGSVIEAYQHLYWSDSACRDALTS